MLLKKACKIVGKEMSIIRILKKLKEIDKLKAINFANTKGTAVPSSIITISMNLNSDQESLRGNGVITSINRVGKNAGKIPNEILFPEKLAGTSLTIGDSLTLMFF